MVKLLLPILFCCGILANPAFARSEQYLSIASGDVASGLFALAGEVASVVSNPEDARACRQNATRNEERCALELMAVAQTSPSASAALNKLRRNSVEAAVVPDDVAYAAYTGSLPEKVAPWPELRTLAVLHSSPVVIITRSNISGMGAVTLTGQRIAIGARNTDRASSRETLLAALGLERGQYTPVSFVNPEDALALIKSSRADAAMLLVSEIDAPLRAALLAGELKLLPYNKGDLERAQRRLPYLQRVVAEVGANPSYATLATSSVLVGRKDMTPPMVQTLLSRLWLRQRASLEAQTATQGLPAPLHTTAIQFYHNHQMLSPAQESAYGTAR